MITRAARFLLPVAARTCVIMLMVITVLPARSQQRVDFLVVEKPQRLLVYNKYQQEPTGQERASIIPYVPMRIITKSDLLSDGFTPCMKVEIDGTTFYLGQEKDGELIGSKVIGFNKTYENATFLHDSIQVLTPRTIQFSDLLRSTTSPLEKGERLVRIFVQNGQTFALKTGRAPAYGWLSLEKSRENHDWKVLTESDRTPDVIPDHIVQNVQATIDETNEVLSHLFGYFNNQTHQHLPSPHWQLNATPELITCILRDATSGQDFAASTRLLSKDLENSILGSGLRVVSEPGKIEIRKN